MPDHHRLTDRVIRDLEDAGYDPQTLCEHCSEREIFNLWLEVNGIIGYTSAIIAALDSIRAATQGDE